MAITIKKIEKWSAKKKTAKLLKALSVDSLEIRISTIQALGKVQDESVMHTLITLLKDPDPSIRGCAAETLGNLANGRSLEFLRQMWMNEPEEEAREKAKQAIAKIKANAGQTEKV